MNQPASTLLTCCVLVASLGSQSTPLVLTDVTASVGIGWTQRENGLMMGAGGAFLDYDGDGWQDVLLAGGVSTPSLYRNIGGTQFHHVPQAQFQPSPGWNYMATVVADIDNDGDPDVLFARWGPNLLYRNDGGGVFTDITTPLVAGSQFDFTAAAAFGDYDGDGKLDLYLGNYIAQFSYPNHTPGANRLLRGNGDGTFTDVTTPVLAGAGTALATTWTDFDADGDPDIWLGNDFGAFIEPNQIYRNDGPATGGGWLWTECSASVGADIGIYCMGIAIGDIDRDRDFDYYFTNLGRNVLLRNDPTGFADVTTQTGTELTYDAATSNPALFATSWGCGFHDFDLDGWVDLYVSNGHIPAAPEIANGTNTRNTLYRHDGAALTFTEMPLALDDGIGRGCAFADYDNDGDIDVLQCNVLATPNLLRNDSPRSGAWLGASLSGRLSNRDALGARAEADTGAFVSIREVSRNDSFEASSAPDLNFGLGAATRVRELAIRWPSGIDQQLFDLPTNAKYGVLEPLVTASDAQTSVMQLAHGKLLTFETVLENHSAQPITAYAIPHLRVGYARANSPAAGTVVWNEPLRVIPLAAGERRRATASLLVPNGVAVPGPPLNLDFVWTVADAALGVDESKVALRLQ